MSASRLSLRVLREAPRTPLSLEPPEGVLGGFSLRIFREDPFAMVVGRRVRYHCLETVGLFKLTIVRPYDSEPNSNAGTGIHVVAR